MTSNQSETSNPSESATGYVNSLGSFVKELKPEEKLIGALLVGILALLFVVIPSVPEDSRIVVWFITVALVLVSFLLFNYWTKHSASKLSRIKKERDYWETKAENLRKDYDQLATNNNSRLSEIDIQIQQINRDIAQISERGRINSQEASVLIQELTQLAEAIQKQIAQNSSDVGYRIGVGIKIVENASEIARKLVETDS
ncbi:MAG: hypothetical protein KME16_20010 [Scytolyngbya sp. HA4215-MV1]|jgi:hypothetical protein|nr:hypothetical protein [Scytolyngbya sp. HA4215-MV1]